MVSYLKKDFVSSKVNSNQRKKIKNELLTNTKAKLSKISLPVPESTNNVELSSTIKFSAFWLEFSALLAELDTLATKIKALDD